MRSKKGTYNSTMKGWTHFRLLVQGLIARADTGGPNCFLVFQISDRYSMFLCISSSIFTSH